MMLNPRNDIASYSSDWHIYCSTILKFILVCLLRFYKITKSLISLYVNFLIIYSLLIIRFSNSVFRSAIKQPVYLAFIVSRDRDPSSMCSLLCSIILQEYSIKDFSISRLHYYKELMRLLQFFSLLINRSYSYVTQLFVKMKHDEVSNLSAVIILILSR